MMLMDGQMHTWNSNTGGNRRAPVTVITVLTGALEQTVAQVLTSSVGVVLQRRCADVSELLGAAQSGAGMVAVIGSEVRGFDRALIEALRRENLLVIAINDPSDQYSLQRIAALGISHCVRAEEIVEKLPEMVRSLGGQTLHTAPTSTHRDVEGAVPESEISDSTTVADGFLAAEETVSRSLIAQLRASIAETEEELFDSYRSQSGAPVEITHDSFRPPADELLEVLGTSVDLWGAQDRIIPELEVSSDSPSIAQMRNLMDALTADENGELMENPLDQETKGHLSADKLDKGTISSGKTNLGPAQLGTNQLGTNHLDATHLATESENEGSATRNRLGIVEHTFSRTDDLPTSKGRRGKVIVVWSPQGAPGRSTIAAALSFSLSGLSRSSDPGNSSKLPWFKRSTAGKEDGTTSFAGSQLNALLVDADTYAPAQAQALGLLDESSGLAQACRAANQGLLSAHSLSQSVQVVRPGVHLLTGIPRPERWTELSPHALQAVFEQAREDYAWTVVDCAPPVEFDEILSYESRAPQRNSATRTALECADLVVIVGKSDPVSIKRLVGSIGEYSEGPASHTPSMVVVNQAPTRVSGKNRRAQVSKALKRFANVDEPFFVGYEPEAALGSLELGQALNETKNRSEFAQSIQTLTSVISAGFVETGRVVASGVVGNVASPTP